MTIHYKEWVRLQLNKHGKKTQGSGSSRASQWSRAYEGNLVRGLAKHTGGAGYEKGSVRKRPRLSLLTPLPPNFDRCGSREVFLSARK